MRRRTQHSKTERAGLLAVEAACNGLDLIWRDLLQEDVGVDGTIEIAIGDFPTGKLVGAQVKSGGSYIRSETETSFKFYPKADDLEYWSSLSIPLFLFVHNPADGKVYWIDIAAHVQERASNPLGQTYLQFDKRNIIDVKFEAYLLSKFDIATYDAAKFGTVMAELEAIQYQDSKSGTPISVSALELFVEGLWGLCSKVQFHSSLLTDIIRQKICAKGDDTSVRYSFSRSVLYPFFTQYFNTLTKHHLASIDATDVNHSLYAKLEFPTFISTLTTNGRRFVEFLRDAGLERIHDNQFFTLSRIPHVQIEIYQSFKMTEDGPEFGPYMDVIAISFNSHLDIYTLEHWQRTVGCTENRKVASQTAFYFELTDYIERRFGEVQKENILLRHLEIPLTPFICWLEDWYGAEQSFTAEELSGKSNMKQHGFVAEMQSILGGVGTMCISEPALPILPIRLLANGELLSI